MKPKARTQSTSATPARRSFTLGSGTAVVGLASATAVALPTARAAMPGNPRLALLIGLAPLLPYVLMATAFAVMYLSGCALAMFVIMYCLMTGRDPARPLRYLTALFTLFTNPLTAFMTMKPVSFAAIRSAELSRAPSDRSRERSLNALPAAPGTARAEDTPVFWGAVQHMAQAPGGRLDIVPPSDQASQRAGGRHARQEAPESVETPSLAGSPA